METKNDFSFYLNSPEYHFNNKEVLQNLLKKLNYIYPSSIQKKVLSNFLNNSKNNPKFCSIIKSQVGTGKTLAYLIPLIQSINFSLENQIQAIIITPTRELALQTEEYINKINKIKYRILIGGKANIPGKVKKEKLEKNNIPTIMIGTLGKLREILVQKKAKTYSKNYLKNLKCIVIDEADKMIDQNKPPQNLLESFLNYLFSFLLKYINSNNDKNIILCSASFNKDVETFYSKIIQKYIQGDNIFNYFSTSEEMNIDDKSEENEDRNKNMNMLNENIKEYFINFYEKKHESFYEQKYKILIILLSSLQKKYNQCLIFYNKKSKGQELSQDLRNYGFSICFIHGELNQDERQLIYYKIKALDYKIILSTDLLSRGIDLTAVNLVINFDLAFDSIEQNHRNGRTGRFFEKGVVISLIENKTPENKISNENSYNSDEINNLIEKIKNEFIVSERLTKDEINKINLGQNNNNDVLKEALTEINGVNLLLQKKRKLQFEHESIIKDDINNEKYEEDIEEKEEDENKCLCNNNDNKENKNKKFCLYCDFFKIFEE